MRLEPLYRICFTYPESWSVTLDGGWQQLFFIAEGRCEGSITGRFRGANFPQRRGVMRSSDLPCRSMAARYSAQSGCSPAIAR